MRSIFFIIVVFAFGSLVYAAENEPVIDYERQESLELPGLTAGCHVCEWRPKLNSMAAREQCGMDDTGKPLAGLFECGYSEDCQRVCHFLGCEGG